jgi:uncharacterized membrane protein
MRNRRTCTSAAILLAAAAVYCGESQGAAVFFQGMGDLAGGTTNSVANGVSGNGNVAIGTSNSANGNEAATYSPNGLIAGLGAMSVGGYRFTAGNAASQDGQILVGAGTGPNGAEAIRYVSGSPTGIGALQAPGSPGFFSVGLGVSRSGDVVVGQSTNVNGFDSGFIWTTTTGMVELPDLPGSSTNSLAKSVDITGKYVVGHGRSLTPTAPQVGRTEAAIWTVNGATATVAGLGDLPHGPNNTLYESDARGISDDGLVIAGYAHGDGDAGTPTGAQEAVRWTSNTAGTGYTPQRLGDLAGGLFQSAANAVSGDGKVIVGRGNIQRQTDPNAHTEAFVWRSDIGMMALSDFLVNADPTLATALSGWTLTEATGVSQDGTVIVGIGQHQLTPGDATSTVTEGWLVSIPEPVALPIAIGVASLLGRRKRR